MAQRGRTRREQRGTIEGCRPRLLQSHPARPYPDHPASKQEGMKRKQARHKRAVEAPGRLSLQDHGKAATSPVQGLIAVPTAAARRVTRWLSRAYRSASCCSLASAPGWPGAGAGGGAAAVLHAQRAAMLGDIMGKTMIDSDDGWGQPLEGRRLAARPPLSWLAGTPH